MLTRALLNTQRRFIQARPMQMFALQTRSFAEVQVVNETPTGGIESIESKNARLGVDTQFDQ